MSHSTPTCKQALTSLLLFVALFAETPSAHAVSAACRTSLSGAWSFLEDFALQNPVTRPELPIDRSHPDNSPGLGGQVYRTLQADGDMPYWRCFTCVATVFKDPKLGESSVDAMYGATRVKIINTYDLSLVVMK